MAKVSRSFRIDADVLAAFEAEAERRGLTKTEALHEALSAWSGPDTHEERDEASRRLTEAQRRVSELEADKAALIAQVAARDAQISEAQAATRSALDVAVAAQETARAAQVLHARQVAALESEEQKAERRWRWPWSRG